MSDPMFDDLMATEEGRRAYYSEGLIFKVTELICKMLKDKQITRKQLADRIGVTKGHISQLLSGEHNMTLETAAEIFYALGCQITVEAIPIKVDTYADVLACCQEIQAVLTDEEPTSPKTTQPEPEWVYSQAA